MGPIEVLFLAIILFFGIVGVVRGLHRELGVTLILLVGLFLIEFSQEQTQAAGVFTKLLAFLAPGNAQAQATTKAILFTVFLIIMAFISYQGESLSFAGAGRNPVLAFIIGLLNGYLFAGTVWYYNHLANWPILPVTPNYSETYRALVTILPPAVLAWQVIIVLVAFMLILRVWK